jgi:hypothetical protein
MWVGLNGGRRIVDWFIPISNTYTDAEAESLILARDLCLGKKEERTRDGATKTWDGRYIGGTAFERNKRANPVKPNIRCFSIGSSFESPTRIMAPCADNKIAGEEDAVAIKMRQTLLKVSGCLT